MIRDGKALEAFVAQIEKEAGLPDATVTSRVKAYADNGKQIAEFDIVIEGRFGTTDMRWLIECRDRPGSGAAPNNWIYELIGRKDGHVKFDRVTAVSTTGFAEGCRELADPHRIELRTVKEVDPTEFASWIEPGDLRRFERFSNLKHANFGIDWGDEPEQPELIAPLLGHGADAVRLWSERSQTHCSPREAFLRFAQQHELWDGLEIGEKKSVQFAAAYVPDDRFELDLGERRLPLSVIEYFGELWVEETSVPPVADRYVKEGENQEVIAERVQFPVVIQGHNAVLELVKLGENGPTQIQMRIVD